MKFLKMLNENRKDKYTVDDKAIERLSIALMGRMW